tara:strand:+ start:4330 stop:4935 length:606 start_codon:yes stop_codon:yes gene_type:complete
MEGSVINTIHGDSDSDSDSDVSYTSDEIMSSNIGVRFQPTTITDQERFIDNTRVRNYETFRNTYFTPQITKHNILVDLDSGDTTTITNFHPYGVPLGHVIGFKYVKGLIHYSGVNHIDIVIPEIPYIACLKNVDGTHIIERIATYSTSLIQYDENKNIFGDIYFTPIKLSTLHITTTGKSTGSSFLEFEVTVLNNTNNAFR